MNTFTLTLDAEEKTYLEALVDADLRETRVELRRTDNPKLHDELHHRENMIRALLEKLRGNKVPDGVSSRS